MTQDSLADHFDMSRSTIDKRCRTLGLKKGQPKGKITAEIKEDIWERLVLDQPLRFIAKELKINRARLMRHIKQSQTLMNVYVCKLRRTGKNGQKKQGDRVYPYVPNVSFTDDK